MKVLQFFAPGGIESPQIRELADPGAPGPNEVRVRVQASSLNGHDLNVALGRLPVADGRILLTDGAGIVEAVGKDVTDLTVGRNVVSTFFPDWRSGIAPRSDFSRTPGDGIDGYGAEVVIRPAAWFTRIPEGWSTQQAATLPTAGLTAWRAIMAEAAVQAGETVLLLGTGGVSIFALQMAKRRGARVIVTSSSDDKLANAISLGADATVNYRKTPEWGEEVRRLTEGRGVDVVVETGGPGTLPQSIHAAAIGARIVLVGVLTGIQGQVPTVALMSKQIKLTGVTVGSYAHQVEMLHDLDAMGFEPIVDKAFSMHDVTLALQHQQSGQHFGKVSILI